MSEENVEIVRRIFDAAKRRDADAIFALYDPDVEFDNSRARHGGLLRRGVLRGHEGIRRFFREYTEAWEDISENLEELIDAGEHVISVVTTRARGRASGAEVGLSHAGVWTIRNGRVVRVVWLGSRDEALEAAGLSE